MTIRVFYSCGKCGLTCQPCEVPARISEEVMAWVTQSTGYVAADHRRLRPGCDAQTVHLLVPMIGTEKIGGPVVQ